jgi:hypothetical protein
MEHLGVTLVAIVGSWAAITGVIWTMGERAENVISPEGRKLAADWLQSENLGPLIGTWAQILANAFDHAFGKRHLSWRCFLSSCLASVICVILITALWAAVRPLQFLSFIHSKDSGLPMPVWSLVATGFLSLIPDYISLLKGRRIIVQLQRTKSFPVAALLVAADIILSAAIGFMAFSMIFFFTESPFDFGVYDAITSIPGSIGRSWAFLLDYVIPMNAASAGYPTVGLWFYATFLTSVWVLLYAASGILIRISGTIRFISTFLKRFCDVREKPILSLAVITISIITLLYIGIGAVILI